MLYYIETRDDRPGSLVIVFLNEQGESEMFSFDTVEDFYNYIKLRGI